MFELSALSGERAENNCGTWIRYSRRRSLNGRRSTALNRAQPEIYVTTLCNFFFFGLLPALFKAPL
jgi:hypothetical protein